MLRHHRRVITYGLCNRLGGSSAFARSMRRTGERSPTSCPRDDQREFAARLAAHYLLLSTREND
jgi:hypothetical protein